MVRRSDGTLEAGRTLPGRGAWVCPGTDPSGNVTCIDLAERRKAFPRAFKAELTDGAIEALRARLKMTSD